MTFKNKMKQLLPSLKQGLLDIKLVLVEGNYKLFLKPLLVAGVFFLGYRYAAGLLQARDENIMGQIEALHAQQNNEKDYLDSKRKLLDLEPRFPDINAKKSWLGSQIEEIFNDSTIDKEKTKVSSSQTEDTSNSGYTIASRQVDMTASYPEFGKLLASIEGREEFLRVSEFSIDKGTNADELGLNTIKMRINTVFPTELVAPTLFKDEVAKRGKK